MSVFHALIMMLRVFDCVRTRKIYLEGYQAV